MCTFNNLFIRSYARHQTELNYKYNICGTSGGHLQIHAPNENLTLISRNRVTYTSQKLAIEIEESFASD